MPPRPPLPLPLPLLRTHAAGPVRSTAARSLSTSVVRRSGHGEPHYNEPSGWLFGEKPLPPGQKRKWEDWELPWYVGMYGGLLFCAVGLYYKPDTSIQSWAMKEARKRMEERGEQFQYVPSKYVRGSAGYDAEHAPHSASSEGEGVRVDYEVPRV